MTPPELQVTQLFLPLNGQVFATYGELETAVRNQYRAARRLFPSDFTYRDAISWADEQGWLGVRDGKLVATIPPVHDAAA